MRIKVLQNTFITGAKSFTAGEEREVTDEIGNMLIERGQAEKMKAVKESEPKAKVPAEQESKKPKGKA